MIVFYKKYFLFFKYKEIFYNKFCIILKQNNLSQNYLRVLKEKLIVNKVQSFSLNSKHMPYSLLKELKFLKGFFFVFFSNDITKLLSILFSLNNKFLLQDEFFFLFYNKFLNLFKFNDLVFCLNKYSNNYNEIFLNICLKSLMFLKKILKGVFILINVKLNFFY